MTKQEEDLVKKLFEPTIDNAIRDMKMAKLLFVTRGNQFDSSIVNEYMRDKEKFLPFILEERQEEFFSNMLKFFRKLGLWMMKILHFVSKVGNIQGIL